MDKHKIDLDYMLKLSYLDRKFDFKYLISFKIFVVLLIPHIIWLFNNDFITITYGLARTGLELSSITDLLALTKRF